MSKFKLLNSYIDKRNTIEPKVGCLKTGGLTFENGNLALILQEDVSNKAIDLRIWKMQ